MALSLRAAMNAREEALATCTIPPQGGIALHLRRGALLHIVDPEGEQVADVTAVSLSDVGEIFSAGRTIDYNGTTKVTEGHRLFSNRSRALFTIVADEVRVHDLLLAPCSREMFEILRGQTGHPSCFENISRVLQPYGVDADAIDSTLNVFMHVEIRPDGAIRIHPPASRPGQRIVLRAEIDLIAAVTACSSEATNNGTCKPVRVLYG